MNMKSRRISYHEKQLERTAVPCAHEGCTGLVVRQCPSHTCRGYWCMQFHPQTVTCVECEQLWGSPVLKPREVAWGG